jgi:hypothetical protein
MRGKLNIALQFEDENNGEIIRSSKVDIYLDSLDECSIDYIKECMLSACNSVINIINDI